MRPAPRHTDPDFVPSLRLLVEREKYSLTDIGMMFEVSRERVRQWCEQYGIERPEAERHRRGLLAVRVWNNERDRFEPIRRGAFAEERRRRGVEQRRSAHVQKVSDRRAHMIAVLSALREQLGRDPTIAEMATAVVGQPVGRNRDAMTLISIWGPPGRHTRERYKATMEGIRSATGIRPRPKGSAGRLINAGNQRVREKCKRGHLLAETRAGRGCRVCTLWRRRKYYAIRTGNPIPQEPIAIANQEAA